MADHQAWEFEDAELPSWARREAAQAPPSWRTAPAPTQVSAFSLVGRLFVCRLLFAAAFAATLICGAKISEQGKVLEYTLTAAIVGLVIGVVYFLWALANCLVSESYRQGAFMMPTLKVSAFAPLVAIPIIATASVPLSALIAYLFANRFLGLLVLILACVFLHYRLGPDLLAFAREKLLTNIVVGAKERDLHSQSLLHPQLSWLVTALLIVLVVPALFSVTLGIVALVGYLGICLVQQVKTLQSFGPWPRVLAAVLVRGERTALDYCDYEATENFHWKPRRERASRITLFVLLTLTLDIALLVGLTCFFPWELAAALTVPGYELPLSLVTHYATSNFQWILTPIELASQAKPPVLYLAGILIALPLFIFVPPAVLLATYLPGLVELEKLAQETKRHYR